MAVIVYGIPHCPKCAASKALLKRKGVSFEEFDVANNKEKSAEMLEKLKSFRNVEGGEVMMPVIDIEGIIIEGFNREKIEQALKEKGLASK